ncbi:peptide chain release factor N(5)-glutamine methyltransferase [Roseobacter litoralis]|uniref:Release factor glutamine methyltransferase n=1 Tax=Roseobacter litoralis (strain ATCC 49566 / DSM 6996 / JCM 21268 / NBRC 15278 / OCh 149) TaxID=391595 RepID=F7ZBE0_ROSLO|nr:peptide chain release factor N(5)-glutamine methyltransferase [Roseobacter litoralis]AEI94326.1 modification methylase, HemK family [Roseobacter litoralis Och 149]
MTAAEAMVAAMARLRAAGVPDPARDARVLLAHAAQVDAARVTLIAPEDMAADIIDRYDHLVSLRAVRVPVSQLIGSREFYGRRFNITREVLDPRPETESLIEAALSAPFSDALDLGVGSGCLIVTLLAERPDAKGVAIDISEAACLQASANAVLHEVADRVQVLKSDWFDAVEGRFDLIVSNPPYLAASEMSQVQPELRDHEPRLALTDEADGLTAYRVIAAEAQGYLSAEGRVLVETGWQQASSVRDIFEAQGWGELSILPDLGGRDRIVSASKPG